MTDYESTGYSEIVLSIGTFGGASGIYMIISPEKYFLDFVLLGIASLLPSKSGLRIGSIAGIFMGPAFASIKNLNSFDTYLPKTFLEMVSFFGANGKLFFGLFGAILGAIVFRFLYKELYFASFFSNVLASTSTGFSICVIWGFILLTFGIANKHPPPNLMQNLFLMGLQDIFICSIFALGIGTVLSAIELILRRVF